MLIVFKRNIYPDDRAMAQWMLDAGSWLGVEDDGDGLDFFIDPVIESEVHGTINNLAIDDQEKWIAFAPGARHATKRWSIDAWCDLAERIVSSSRCRIMIFGDEVDKPLGDEIVDRIGDSGWNAAGQMSLSQSAAAISHCQMIITHDSGLMHVATARRIPVVAIFGPTVRAFGFHPFRVPYRVVEQSLKCRPCSTKGSSRCPLGHFRCMQEITPEHVFSAFKDLADGL
jgi:heptosyltransferase-2